MSYHTGNKDTETWASAACASGTTLFSPCGGDRSHVHFPGPCVRWTSFTAGPALVKSRPHLLIAFQCLLPAHTRFSLWKVRKIHKMWKPRDLCVPLLWGASAPTTQSAHSDDGGRVPYEASVLFFSFTIFYYSPKLKNNFRYFILRCIILNSSSLFCFP